MYEDLMTPKEVWYQIIFTYHKFIKKNLWNFGHERFQTALPGSRQNMKKTYFSLKPHNYASDFFNKKETKHIFKRHPIYRTGKLIYEVLAEHLSCDTITF
jgi:hypothetical protein